MPWARFEDDYLGNKKLTTLSTAAIALDMAAIIYSARELRDGSLSSADVEAIAALIHLRRWQPAAAELVGVRRWSRGESGYEIHDYLDYQPSREHVLQQRAEAADRMRRYRGKHGDVRANFDRSNGEVFEKFGNPVHPGPGPYPERSQSEHSRAPQSPPGGACCVQFAVTSAIHATNCSSSQRTWQSAQSEIRSDGNS